MAEITDEVRARILSMGDEERRKFLETFLQLAAGSGAFEVGSLEYLDIADFAEDPGLFSSPEAFTRSLNRDVQTLIGGLTSFGGADLGSDRVRGNLFLQAINNLDQQNADALLRLLLINPNNGADLDPDTIFDFARGSNFNVVDYLIKQGFDPSVLDERLLGTSEDILGNTTPGGELSLNLIEYYKDAVAGKGGAFAEVIQNIYPDIVNASALREAGKDVEFGRALVSERIESVEAPPDPTETIKSGRLTGEALEREISKYRTLWRFGAGPQDANWTGIEGIGGSSDFTTQSLDPARIFIDMPNSVMNVGSLRPGKLEETFRTPQTFGADRSLFRRAIEQEPFTNLNDLRSFIFDASRADFIAYAKQLWGMGYLTDGSGGLANIDFNNLGVVDIEAAHHKFLFDVVKEPNQDVEALVRRKRAQAAPLFSNQFGDEPVLDPVSITATIQNQEELEGSLQANMQALTGRRATPEELQALVGAFRQLEQEYIGGQVAQQEQYNQDKYERAQAAWRRARAEAALGVGNFYDQNGNPISDGYNVNYNLPIGEGGMIVEPVAGTDMIPVEDLGSQTFISEAAPRGYSQEEIIRRQMGDRVFARDVSNAIGAVSRLLSPGIFG